MDVISLALARKALDPKANVYEFKGSCAFEDLPEEAFPGEVWNITDDFDLDGKHYEAGTNVAYTNDGWDALTASIDTSIFELNANKVTSLSDQSTDEQYPSAKAVFDGLKNIDITNIKLYAIGYSADSPIIFDELPFGIYMNTHSNTTFYCKATRNGEMTTLAATAPILLIHTKAISNSNWHSYLIYYNSDGQTIISGLMKNNQGKIVIDYGGQSIYALGGFLRYNKPQTISGVKTFSSLPVSTPVPTQDGQLTNKKYVDDAIANIDISTATSAQIQALFGTEGGE